jgi:hypothetical protein
METKQALQVIEQALNIANNKGVFKLEESATVFAAYSTLKQFVETPASEDIKEAVVKKTK